MISAGCGNTGTMPLTEGMRPDNWNAHGTKRIRRMEITLETNRVYVTRRRRTQSTSRWCATCGYGFRMVTALTATALADISFRTLYRWAETEEIHFNATAEGALLVCLDSLLARANAQAHQAATELATA